MARTFYPALICVSILSLQYAFAVPIKNSKITPVDLDYECVHKTDNRSNKAPIVLLHGLGAMKSHWDGTYEVLAFSTGRRVCRADLRNHGDSPWDGETSVAAMTEDVIHLLDTIGEETAVIIGHSLGGKIAIHTALNYPARVDRIVAEDISPNVDPQVVESIIMLIKTLQSVMEQVPEGSDEKQATEFIFSHFKDWMNQFNLSISDEQMEQVEQALTCPDGKCRWKANFDAIVGTIERGLDMFWTPSSGRYEGSALFIYGMESEFKVNEEEENIRKLFPKAKLVGVEGAGHAIHGLFPKFDVEVLKFLDEN
ncbi:protein ABHD11-like [Uloborus diversus]|uniref:protein ABHD11-like n=1 Tax=Uloborus diversus TaxID=327109 RepID=UPI00240A5388|nr:protein ABHD11-like [Uloborus diversus]